VGFQPRIVNAVLQFVKIVCLGTCVVSVFAKKSTMFVKTTLKFFLIKIDNTHYILKKSLEKDFYCFHVYAKEYLPNTIFSTWLLQSDLQNQSSILSAL